MERSQTDTIKWQKYFKMFWYALNIVLQFKGINVKEDIW